MKSALLIAAVLLTGSLFADEIPTFAAANLVLGQPDFTTSTALTPPTPLSLSLPTGVAVDPGTGKVFVVDQDNNRVLRYPDAATLANGGAAEAVFGQANFSASDINRGDDHPAANTMAAPSGLILDLAGRLWVADEANSRVLRFDTPLTSGNGVDADGVLGQPDFVSDSHDVGDNMLSAPTALAIDDHDFLWVVDSGNNRVVRFSNAPALDNGSAASAVIGQPDLDTSTSGTSQTALFFPSGIAIDASGTLWICDAGNERILRFDNAATLDNQPSADAVLGQANFDTSASGMGAASLNVPIGITVSGTTLWVADRNNNRVLRFDDAASKANGAAADAVLGQPDFDTTFSDVTAQKMTFPNNVFIDTSGNLWTTDGGNNRILRFSPVATPDTTRPVLTLQGSKRIVTTNRRVVLKGTASDDTAIARIEYQAGKGGYQKTRGNDSHWKVILRLAPDEHRAVIKIRALDTSGNLSPLLRAKVIRK